MDPSEIPEIPEIPIDCCPIMDSCGVCGADSEVEYRVQNYEELAYQGILCKLLSFAPESNRTGVDAHATFHEVLKFTLVDAVGRRILPLITSKFTSFKAVYFELIWFLRGCKEDGEVPSTKYLVDNGIKIWDDNTTREFLDSRGLHHLAPGQTGPIYGAQWRDWTTHSYDRSGNLVTTHYDQLADVIWRLISNPQDRRLIVSAWNVGDLDKVTLPSCHYSYQFCVIGGYLNCLVNMRSADIALGVPFNIASYALLTHIVSVITKIPPGDVSISMANCHLYVTHADGAREMILRDPRPFPTLRMPGEDMEIPKNIEEVKTALRRFSHEFTREDYKIIGYRPHPTIKLPMAI